MVSGKMKLGAFLHPAGHHIAAWRSPESPADSGYSLRNYAEMARTAERGLFDLIFLADISAVPSQTPEQLAHNGRARRYEPIVLLSALAGLTSDIGLVGTASTTYYEPFHVARKFATLDDLSAGRSGWNVVTSVQDAEAQNFSQRSLPEHDGRYVRAREFVEVVKKLWDSWDDGAFVNDKESGLSFTPGSLHATDHAGTYFSVRGPLPNSRPPQGHPVIFQAGSSEAGKTLAAETADVVFAAHSNIDAARRFYADLKGRLPVFGRAPEDLKIMPGLLPVVAPSRAEAEDLFAGYQALIHPLNGLAQLSGLVGNHDLTRYDLDGPLPDIAPTNGSQTRQSIMLEMARRDNLSIRQLYERVAAGRGHATVIGSVADVADLMQEWFETGACDGFNIMPAAPGSLDSFVALVTPELQRRGLFRTEYEGPTLREKLGLRRPPSRHAGGAAPA